MLSYRSLYFLAIWGLFSPNEVEEAPPHHRGGHPIQSASLPEHAVNLFGTTVFRHSDSVLALSFSQDNRTLASASKDGTVRIWDSRSGKECEKTSLNESIHCMARSPVTSTLAIGTNKGVWLWNCSSRQLPKRFGTGALMKLSSPKITLHIATTAVVFSEDGSQVAWTDQQGGVCLADVATGKILWHFEGRPWAQSGELTSLALFGKRGMLAFSKDQTIHIWDTKNGKEVYALRGHVGRILSITISPDQRLLVSSSEDRTVRIWDLQSTRELVSLPEKQIVSGLQFSRNGLLLACGNIDGVISVYLLPARRCLFQLQGQRSGIASLAFSPDGNRLASGGEDEAIYLWDCTTGNQLHSPKAHMARVWDLAISPNRKLMASASGDGSARVWDLQTGQEVACLLGHEGSLRSVRFSPEGSQLATCGDDGTIRVWNWRARKELLRLKSHDGRVHFLAFAKEGSLLFSSGDDNVVRCWELPGGKETSKLSVGGYVSSLIASPNSSQLAIATDKEIVLFDSATRTESKRLMKKSGGSPLLAYSSDGRFLAAYWKADQESPLTIYESASGNVFQPNCFPPIRRSLISSMAFVSADRIIACGTVDGRILLMDLSAASPLTQLQTSSGPILCLAPIGNGRHFASGNADSTVLLWRTPTGTERKKPEPKRGQSSKR